MERSDENSPRDVLPLNRDNFRIICYDINSITLKHLLFELNPGALFFNDSNPSLDLLKTLPDEEILLIISGSFAEKYLSQIHLNSFIFIFDTEQNRYQSLKTTYQKVVGIFTNQKNLIQSINETLIKSENGTTNFSLFDQKQTSSRILSKESSIFLWHQLLLHVLKEIPQDQQSKDEFLHQWKRFSQSELDLIKLFEETYHRDQAIEWYTKECGLYKLLNRALRTENIQLIYSFRYFLIDLSSAIAEEYLNNSDEDFFTVYRGQYIGKDEFNRWKNHLACIISINSFLSTSRNEQSALQFIRRQNIVSEDLLPVLFQIQIDPNIKSIIYADISHRTGYSNEQEILFDLNSIFKIISIDFDSVSNIWKIQLQTTQQDREDVNKYLQYVMEEMYECSPTIYFGWLILNSLGQIDQAEEYFQMLLNKFSEDHPDYASSLNGIGRVYSVRDQLELALKNYRLALEIRQKRFPENRLRLAASLHNIGNILREKEQLDSALEHLQQALQIEEDHHLNDHLQKAVIIQNIANTLTAKGFYEDALEKLSNAYEMFKRLLPEKHPNISTCLIDMGSVYQSKGDFDKALSYYHQALDIDECCLQVNHPSLIKDFRHIAFAYRNDKLEEFRQFASAKVKHLENMPENNNIYIAQIFMTMGNVIEHKARSEGLKYYQKALIHLEKSKPIDPKTIGKCLEDIGRVYGTCGKFEEAFSNLSKALEWYHQVWSIEHTDIARVYRIIAFAYQANKQTIEALEYFNKSLEIYRTNYGNEHSKVKEVKQCVHQLISQQQTSIETDQKILENEQRTIEFNTEPMEENGNDQQSAPIIIVDSDIRPVIVEPLPVSVGDTTITATSISAKTKSGTEKTSKSSRKCSSCEIL